MKKHGFQQKQLVEVLNGHKMRCASLTIQECINNLKWYKEKPINPTRNGWNFGRKGKTSKEVDEQELQRFIDTMNKAIKIINKYEQIKQK